MKYAFVFLVLSACSCGEKHEAPPAPTLDAPATSPSDTDAKPSDTDVKPAATSIEASPALKKDI